MYGWSRQFLHMTKCGWMIARQTDRYRVSIFFLSGHSCRQFLFSVVLVAVVKNRFDAEFVAFQELMLETERTFIAQVHIQTNLVVIR